MHNSKKLFKTILVIEDEFAIRESLREVLESEGYTVLTAENGQEGLDQLRSLSPDDKPCLILLDLMMPVMGGQEFMQLSQEDVALAPIPVVIFSAVADVSNSKTAKGFLKKPVNVGALLAMIELYACV